MSSRLDYRPDIDGLRALAVLAVIGFHAFPAVVRGGFVGVDVFFVISGYLISGIILKSLHERTFSVPGFYARRIRRIFPSVILVVSTCLVAGWLLLFADEYKHLGLHAAGGSAFVSNFLSWREAGYFDAASTSKPLLHLWSLGIEEQFYLVWPVLLVAMHRVHPRSVPWTIAAIAFSSFLLAVITVGSDPTLAFYSPMARLWEFMIGSALAAEPERIDRLMGARTRNFRSPIGLACIAVAILVFDQDFQFPGWWALLPVFGTFLVISAAPAQAGANPTFLSLPLLVNIGLISFPLYLWHWPLLSFAHMLESGQAGVLLRSMAVAASFLAAWVTYRVIEMRVRHSPGRLVPLGLTALTLTVGGAGLLVSHLDGIPSRVSQRPQQFDVEKMRRDRHASMRAGHCHFHLPEDTFAKHAATIGDCLALDERRINILVLGDSHAFDVRTSLSQAYPEFNFLQLTGSGCTPIEALQQEGSERCRDIVRHVKHDFKQLDELDGIVLSARWSGNFRLLADDIEFFRTRGVPVAVFGPTFEFSDDVPKILGRHPAHNANAMLAAHLLEKPSTLDREMEQFFKSTGVSYVSKMGNLCSGGVCPALGENRELLVLDYGHWTVDGSKYYGDLFRTRRVLENWLRAHGHDRVLQ